MQHPTSELAIEVSDLHKSFGSTALLKGINFSIRQGERVAIVGPGGCGKSILFKILLGLEAVSYTHLTLPTTPYV